MLRHHQTQDVKFVLQHWRGDAQHYSNTNFYLILSRVVRMLRPLSCLLNHEAHYHISPSVGVLISIHWALAWLPCLSRVSRIRYPPNNVRIQSGCTSKNFLMQRRRPSRNSQKQGRRPATDSQVRTHADLMPTTTWGCSAAIGWLREMLWCPLARKIITYAPGLRTQTLRKPASRLDFLTFLYILQIGFVGSCWILIKSLKID